MPLQVPGADHNLRALDLAAPEILGHRGFAHHHRHRRIKPQRLAEDIAGKPQL
jgi:hypothetical protein